PEIRWIASDGVFESAEEVLRESWLSDYFDPVRDLIGDLAPLLLERCFALLSSTMVERAAYHQAGRIDTGFTHACDYDLWMLVLQRHPGGLMADRLVSYFSSPGALSRNLEMRDRDDIRVMRRVAGEGRSDLRGRAAERAASLEFNLALKLLRAGRRDEA